MRITSLIMLLFLFHLSFSVPVLAKEACAMYLGKLHKIQAKQREGHSLKQSHKLKDQENQARETWWNCTKAPSNLIKAYQSNKPTAKATNKKASTNKKTTIKPTKNIASNQLIDTKPSTYNKADAFVNSNTYEGKKLKAWYKYYQQPKQCPRANTMKVFVYCVENKLEQKQAFEKYYQKLSKH